MATLSYLNEPGVLHNILRRFEQGHIYTFTGPILVAVNPYRVLLVLSLLVCPLPHIISRG